MCQRALCMLEGARAVVARRDRGHDAGRQVRLRAKVPLDSLPGRSPRKLRSVGVRQIDSELERRWAASFLKTPWLRFCLHRDGVRADVLMAPLSGEAV